jgi:hypothetical protein
LTIKTTCIGAFPKPGFIHDGNWSEFGQPGQSGDDAKVRRSGLAIAALPSIAATISSNGEHFLDRDVILSGGSINNPKLLMLSGRCQLQCSRTGGMLGEYHDCYQ